MGKEIKNLRKRLIGIIAVLMAGLIVAVLPVDSVFTGDIIYARADEDEAVEAAEDADGEKEAGEDEKKDSQKKSEKDGKEDSKKSAKMKLNKTKVTLEAGDTVALYAQNLAAGDKVSYKTSDKKIASVDASGLVSANKKGDAVVTVTVSHANGKSDSFKCKVSVAGKKKESVKYKDVADTAGLESALLSGKDGAYRLTGKSYSIKQTIVITSSVTIDVNGKMISGSTKESFFQVIDGGNLTLIDNSKNVSCFILNKGDGGVVDCFEGGTLTVDLKGDVMTTGRHLFLSSGDFTLKSGKLSGGESNIYIKDGKATIEGGEISGTKYGIVLENGELVVKDVKMDVTYSCLCANGGNMTVVGGEFRNTSARMKEGFTASVNGGELQINGGTGESSTANVYIGKGKLFVNGGEFKSQSETGYAVYAGDDKPDISVTVNGGSLSSKYVGIYFQNNPDSGLYVNGGTIETTGEVAITATGVPVVISGGKIKCDKTVCVISSPDEEKTVKVTGGTFTGKECLVLSGELSTSIKGGTFKGSSYDLIINSNYDGEIKYDKKLFEKLVDQRKGGEKESTPDSEGYRRIDVTYKKGMYVKDFDTLYSLFCNAIEQLTNELDIFVSEELFVSVYKNFNTLFCKYCGTCNGETTNFSGQQIFHPDGRIEYKIKLNYGMETQINSVSLNKSVYKNADKAVQKYSDEIDEILDSIITKKMTDEEKITAVNDYMCEHYAYADPVVEDGPNSDHSFHAMLDDGTGVCQSYATLFHAMMLKLGIEDTLVCGKGSSNQWGTEWEEHMWNCVVVDGKQLFVDVTWNDSRKSSEYLLKSEKDFYTDGLHKQDIFWK